LVNNNNNNNNNNNQVKAIVTVNTLGGASNALLYTYIQPPQI